MSALKPLVKNLAYRICSSQNNDAIKMLNLLGLLLLCPLLGNAQARISGHVNSPDQDKLAFANILLLNPQDSSLVKGEVSSEEGEYVMENIPSGDYLLSISMLGYEASYSTVFTLATSDDLQMDLSSGALGTVLAEVEVRARKPLFEQQIDRMVINVQNSISSGGATALEVLERSPGITVNQQSNTVNLRGKQGILLMINGKESRVPQSVLTEMLNNMSADNIEKIEVFVTPPAEFDAEGDAGVVNIIMKKREGDGFNGSFSANVGYGRRIKSGANLSFNYRKNRLNLYGNYSPSFRKNVNLYTFDRKVVQEANVLQTKTLNEANSDRLSNRGRVGLDFYLNDKTVFGILFSGYSDKWDILANNNAQYIDSPSKQSSVVLDIDEENKWGHWMTNLNVKHSFQTNKVWTVDFDYLSYDHNNPATYNIMFLNSDMRPSLQRDMRIGKESTIDIFVGKTDYKHGWGDGHQLSVGAKATFSTLNNDVPVDTLLNGEWVPFEAFTQRYELKENIGAAYASYSSQLDSKTKIIIGLRYELTQSNLNSPDSNLSSKRNYGNIFPSLFVSRTINEDQRVQLSFSRRITRPSFKELAPFVSFLDPRTFFAGNPNLRPGLSNSIKADYQFKTVSFSIRYSHDRDIIARYQPVIDVETNTQIYTTKNLDRRNMVDISIDFPIYIKKWWEVQNSISGVWQRTEIEQDKQVGQVIGRSIWLSMTHSFLLPYNFSLELSGRYQSPSYYGILNIKPKGAVDLGIQKKWGNSVFRFNISDIFQTNLWQSETNLPELQLESSNVFEVETRVARISYSYQFGNRKVKRSRGRATGSAAERRRVN